MIVTLGVPAAALYTYENFAGGLLNGIGNHWEQSSVDGNLSVQFIYPLVAIVFYALFAMQFRKVLKYNKSDIDAGRIWILFTIATAMTLVVVFWKAITT